MIMKKTFSILSTSILLALIASLPMAGIPYAVAEISSPQSYPDLTGSSQSVAGPNSSVNVLIIGGPSIIFGGSIPTPGPFLYTNMLVPGLPALGAFDTVILNAASGLVGCDLTGSGALSAADLAALVAFMQAGGKLIIYDSECTSNDFTWLPSTLQFTTNNPGQAGAAGTSAIVEQNVLSTTGGSNPIDVVALCNDGFGDACGDANVLVSTIGTDLCIDMEAANINLAALEPVHVYSRAAPSGSGAGMLIYNGLDYDDSGTLNLQLLTLYELQANFNPHDPSLACGTTVVVGGESMGIDATSLILAGAQTNAVWLMSALAVIGSVAFGALYITSKKN